MDEKLGQEPVKVKKQFKGNSKNIDIFDFDGSMSDEEVEEVPRLDAEMRNELMA